MGYIGSENKVSNMARVVPNLCRRAKPCLGYGITIKPLFQLMKVASTHYIDDLKFDDNSRLIVYVNRWNDH